MTQKVYHSRAFLAKNQILRYNFQTHFMAENHKDHDDTFEKYKSLLKGEAPSECEVCGGTLLLEKVNLEDYQNGKLYMMENVPAYVCQECGEIWVPEPIMEEFEKMIETAKNRKENDTKVVKGSNKIKKIKGKAGQKP